MRTSEVTRTEKGGWNLEQGETITGKVVDIDPTEGAYGPYPVLDLELDDGSVSVHAFHDHLRRKLSSRGAQVGEVVSITYRGRAGNGTGTDAYLYDVKVGTEPKRFDFDELRYTTEPAKPKLRTRDVEREGLGRSVGDVEQQIEDEEDEVPF